MTKIYKNGTLHCIIDDADKAAEALQVLRDCYPDDIWSTSAIREFNNPIKIINLKKERKNV